VRLDLGLGSRARALSSVNAQALRGPFDRRLAQIARDTPWRARGDGERELFRAERPRPLGGDGGARPMEVRVTSPASPAHEQDALRLGAAR